ncbi:MAG: hypothetical protein FWF84_01185, partial [Kiritimatiellaeota bacterium]|nr:hypothetical protein [Kiritimatiellota bacterium]
TVEAGAKITEGMAWTIAMAGTLDVQGERLFKKVLSNHPKWDFAADTIGDTLVITACHRQTATAIIVR